MRRIAYQALGFGVWQGAKWYILRRYNTARRLAFGGLVVAVIAALVLAGRRAASS